LIVGLLTLWKTPAVNISSVSRGHVIKKNVCSAKGLGIFFLEMALPHNGKK